MQLHGTPAGFVNYISTFVVLQAGVPVMFCLLGARTLLGAPGHTTKKQEARNKQEFAFLFCAQLLHCCAALLH